MISRDLEIIILKSAWKFALFMQRSLKNFQQINIWL